MGNLVHDVASIHVVVQKVSYHHTYTHMETIMNMHTINEGKRTLSKFTLYSSRLD